MRPWTWCIAALVVTTLALPAAANHTWMPKASPPHAKGSFRHKRSRIVTELGVHHHSAADLVVAPGSSTTVEGKFAYGQISKDLEDEDVTLWLFGEAGWQRLHTRRTNDDGRATFLVPGTHLTAPGPHAFVLVVEGDGTAASGSIWVMRKTARVAVFDIDGTLTTGDSELVEYIATGNTVQMRPGAVDLVKHWADRGVQPVYLTGRPYLYNRATKAWLAQRGFPTGPLATTKFVGQGMPSESGVGRFKRRWLQRMLEATAANIVAAYGNAKTDICAFARAGIASASTFIIGKNGGRRCGAAAPSQKIGSFKTHLRELQRR